MIKPINVTIRAYGQKSNISKLRKAAYDLLKDEYGKKDVDEAWFVEVDAKDVAQQIQDRKWDTAQALLKLSKSHQGIVITMPEINERFGTEMLMELELAKTCVMLAEWDSYSQAESKQLLVVGLDKWADARHLDVPEEDD